MVTVKKRREGVTRLHNPGERNLVNLHNNPGMLASLFGSSRPKKESEATALFEGFSGQPSTKSALVVAKPGTPSHTAKLGGLMEIALDIATVKRKIIRALGLSAKTDEFGDKAIAFDRKNVALAGDAKGDLHVVGLYIPLPEGLEKGRTYKLGDVVAITYRALKTHLSESDGRAANYEHEFNEDGRGENPRLYYKDGYLFFSGGTYRILAEGISG